jgi:DNA-binding PadR family transcriptional regulator
LDDSRRRYYRLTAGGRKALVAEIERLDNLLKRARGKRLTESLAGAKGGRS